MKIYIENTEIHEDNLEFTSFDEAVQYCENEYGYEGEEWDEVKEEGTLEALHEFLGYDGVYSELEE